MKIDLVRKTALVTGGNVGIGQAIALALAESGADVALTYLSHEKNEQMFDYPHLDSLDERGTI